MDLWRKMQRDVRDGRGRQKRAMARHQRVKAELRRCMKQKKPRGEAAGRHSSYLAAMEGFPARMKLSWKKNNGKKEKDMLLSLVLFCCYFLFRLYKMSIQCHVIGFNFLIENYDIIDNFGSFGRFFFLMWSIFVNVISTLCYSQKQKRQKNTKKQMKK